MLPEPEVESGFVEVSGATGGLEPEGVSEPVGESEPEPETAFESEPEPEPEPAVPVPS